jgi:hypothetical protein
LALGLSPEHGPSSTEWDEILAKDRHRFVNPGTTSIGDNRLTAALTKQRFPFIFKEKAIEIRAIQIFIKVNPEFAGSHNGSTITLTLAAGDTAPSSASHQPSDLLSLGTNGLLRGEKAFANSPAKWTMNMWLNDGERVHPDAIADILLVCHYTVA